MATTPSAQNFILQSEAFDNPSWIKFAVSGANPTVTANVDPGPQGGASTADQVTLSAASSGIYATTNAVGQSTFSVWVRLISGSGAFTFNYYNGATGAEGFQTATATSSWQRLSWTFTGSGDANSNVALMLGSSQASAGTFEFWGAQLNAGATPMTYVPTTGTAIDTTTTGTVSPGSGSTLDLKSSTQGVIVNLATGQWSTALGIMPLGDSITYGWSAQDLKTPNSPTDQGYRGPLWQDFVNNGMLVNFLGDQSVGPASLPDTDNAGYPGERTDQLLARLPGLLATQKPGAILLMAGTNDVKQGVPQATIMANLKSMINMIATANPSTNVYLSLLLPLGPDVPHGAMIASVNDAIVSLVQQESAAGKDVSLVSMSNITTSNLFDEVHPDPSAYTTMAANWYSAILTQQPNIGGTPGGTANTISSSVVSAVGGSGNDLLIGNINNNTLNGGAGNDVLVAGGGNTTFIGGLGADQFDIKAVAGQITIQDFMPTDGDMLVWDHIPGLTSVANLASDTVQSSGRTAIDLSPFGVNLQVTLANYTGDLSHSVFLTG